jgi:hypothetical protein
MVTEHKVADPRLAHHEHPEEYDDDPLSQLDEWLGLLVGHENIECLKGILDALVVLGRDSLGIAATKQQGGALFMAAVGKLVVDIIDIALLLTPKCLPDSRIAAVLGQIYELIQLARDEQAEPLGDTQYVGAPDSVPSKDPGARIHGRMVELIQQIPDMEVLEQYPGLAEQIADTLIAAVRTGSLKNQVQIITTLLPNDVLQKIDDALDRKATDLPGAAFIRDLNDYDNKLGINLIPDDVVDEYAIDLLIRATGVAGLIKADDTESLLMFASLLRNQVSADSSRTVLDRVTSFVKALVPGPRRLPEPEPELEEPPVKPIRIRLTPEPEGLQLREQRELARWKVLAGIQ